MVLTEPTSSVQVKHGSDMLNTEHETVEQLTKENIQSKVQAFIDETDVSKCKMDKSDAAVEITSEDSTDCFILKKSKRLHRATYHPLSIKNIMVYEDEKMDYVYKMDTRVRGKVVLINMKHFGKDTGLNTRKGTNKDAKAIIELFRELSFKIEFYNDVCMSEITDALMEAAQNSAEYSCFICIILSHGENGAVYAYDGSLEIKELAAIFENSSWVGKPKIFLIQACQGHDYMNGVKNPDCIDGNNRDDAGISLPSKVDFLFAYSTAPGFYSWRNTSEGSWFIQCLVEEFRKYAHQLDVLRMLTRVNAMLSLRRSYTDELETNDKRQTMYIVSLLRKDIYFFPPNGQLK